MMEAAFGAQVASSRPREFEIIKQQRRRRWRRWHWRQESRTPNAPLHVNCKCEWESSSFWVRTYIITTKWRGRWEMSINKREKMTISASQRREGDFAWIDQPTASQRHHFSLSLSHGLADMMLILHLLECNPQHQCLSLSDHYLSLTHHYDRFHSLPVSWPIKGAIGHPWVQFVIATARFGGGEIRIDLVSACWHDSILLKWMAN